MIESPEKDLTALAASTKSFVRVDKATVLAATDGVDHPAAANLRQGAVEGSGTYHYFVTAPSTIKAALPHLKLAAEPTVEPTGEPQKATVPASQPPVAPATKTPQIAVQPAPTKTAEPKE